MRIWTDGLLVQCAGIAAGLGELLAIEASAGLIDICYVERPSFFAYKGVHFSAFRRKNGTPIGNALSTTITRLNDIFRGVNPVGTGGTMIQSASQIVTVQEGSSTQQDLFYRRFRYRWIDVQYIYMGQNSTQLGSFSVTEEGIENHVFWGVDVAICGVLLKVDTAQVIISDSLGGSGTLTASISGRIPVPLDLTNVFDSLALRGKAGYC
jgi:hypothetical protein